MKLELKINRIPLELGQKMSDDALRAAAFQRAGLWRRFADGHNHDETVYFSEDCELEGLADEVHIYPCTHSYLDRDRQWRTKATLFLKDACLQRILFQVIDARTAASNFVERFEAAAAGILGDPSHMERRLLRWQRRGMRVETFLHRDRMNADFTVEFDD